MHFSPAKTLWYFSTLLFHVPPTTTLSLSRNSHQRKILLIPKYVSHIRAKVDEVESKAENKCAWGLKGLSTRPKAKDVWLSQAFVTLITWLVGSRESLWHSWFWGAVRVCMLEYIWQPYCRQGGGGFFPCTLLQWWWGYVDKYQLCLTSFRSILKNNIRFSIGLYFYHVLFLVPLFCAQQIPYIPLYFSQVKAKILLEYNGTLTFKNKPLCTILEYVAMTVELID